MKAEKKNEQGKGACGEAERETCAWGYGENINEIPS